MFNADKNLMEKWEPVLGHESAPAIGDHYKKAVTARLLENQEVALREERQQSEGFITEAAANATGSNISNFDPVLISLVRRAMPNLIAYDIAGVQPMSGPTGLIFAMKSKYSTQGGTEALFDEADTDFSGTGTHQADPTGLAGVVDADTDGSIADTADVISTFGEGLPTATAEARGTSGGAGAAFAEMAFSIEKSTVTAKSRALKAEYTMELAQDLKAIHGLDAEGELANILSAEILAEINREVVRTILTKAKIGALQSSTAVSGIFDVATDSDGRWMAEKFKGLIMQLEREANVIAKETRRGKGNYVIVSSDVASALAASGMMDYSPALNTSLNVDDTGNTFAGVLNGRLKVYIDPYATTDFACVGYRGNNPYDAGMFYCPYVPLTMVKAVGESDFQPRIGFKTRYGMVANPFVAADGTGTNRANPYFRIFRVDDIMV
ncbi:MAG: ATP-binding protein [Synechococcus sp. TMED187]|nr:MAG: ATP-binding protein [Synechococcus sp. TMED187]